MKFIKDVSRYWYLPIVLAALAFVIFWAIFPFDAPLWTGFGPSIIDDTVRPAKTLWDWMDLLLVPSILAVGAWLLSRAETVQDRRREYERFEHDNVSRYLELIRTLLIEKKLKAPESSEARLIARTQSLFISREVGKDRKGQILQFLFESGLLRKGNVIINMNGAQLSNGNYNRITLIDSELRGVHFDQATFVDATLDSADFSGSNFTSANMTGVSLAGAKFHYSSFKNAIIRNVDLSESDISFADFTGADLHGSLVNNEQLNYLDGNSLKGQPKLKT